MEINYNRCLNVVKRLDSEFGNTLGLASVEFPETITLGTNDYFRYMFYSCLLDYGMRSKVYHKNLINTYRKYPCIFNPKSVSKLSENDLYDIIINNIHPRYPNVATKKWITLSNELSKYDNILECLQEISSFEDLDKFIKGIKGYGQKTGGLLIRIIYDSKICNFCDDVTSIPIDRHDIEISYLTNIIDENKLSNKQIEQLSNMYVKASKESNVNPSDLDKYLWNVGNSFCSIKKCDNCPLNEMCAKVKCNV